MNNPELISLLIVAAVALVAWMQRGARQAGQDNPVGTAKLQTDVTSLAERFGKMEVKVEEIRRDVDAAPTKADFERLRGDIKALTERTSGIQGHVESVDQAVVRIEMKLDNLAPAPITRRRSK
jgi:outer membrane murein-binding lipoprotein Lpp